MRFDPNGIVMNAAGTVKTIDDVEHLLATPIGTIVVGSITMDQRDGNPGLPYRCSGVASVNSYGLPNPGLEYYKEWLPEMVARAHDASKRLVLSVAGFNEIEWVDLCSMAVEAGVDAIELNFGCPNVDYHAIWSFHPDAMRRIVVNVLDVVGGTAVGVKLSPYSNPQTILHVYEACLQDIAYIASSNTFPNSFLKNTLGGMGGRALKPIAVGQIRQFRDIVDSDIVLIGVGGVCLPEDVEDYQDAGACAVQVATEFIEYGRQIFEELV